MAYHSYLSNTARVVYLQSIPPHVIRTAGDTLDDRTPAPFPFNTDERDARGAGVGDLVDSMIEGRVAFEKIKVLESRVKYQIEKLVRSQTICQKTSPTIPWLFDLTLKMWSRMNELRTRRRTEKAP